MVDSVRDPLKFHQQVLGLRAERQRLLASNIANADTPHYKARDIDFRRALSSALGGAGGPLALSRTAAAHLAAKTDGAGSGTVRYRTDRQGSVDGNTVDMDVERAAFAENAIHYEASITFINAHMRSLRGAITGQ